MCVIESRDIRVAEMGIYWSALLVLLVVKSNSTISSTRQSHYVPAQLPADQITLWTCAGLSFDMEIKKLIVMVSNHHDVFEQS